MDYAAAATVPVDTLLLVYDLGGGSFDVALLRRTTDGFEHLIEPAGIDRLGGIDIDEALFRHVVGLVPAPIVEAARQHGEGMAALAQLRQRCVEAKEALSSDSTVDVPVMLPGHVTTVRITRPEFEEMIRPMIEQTIDLVARTVRQARITPQSLQAVLLVGGSSRIPIVEQLVGVELQVPVRVAALPKLVVAKGAARQAAAGRTRGLTGRVPSDAGGRRRRQGAARRRRWDEPEPSVPPRRPTSDRPGLEVPSVPGQAPTHLEPITPAGVVLGVSAPKRVRVLRSFVARLAAYRPADREQAKRQLRGARGRATPALGVASCRWANGTEIRVSLSGKFVEVDNPTVLFIWSGDVSEAAFDVTVTRNVPEVVLRFSVEANGVPVAAPRLEVAVGRRRLAWSRIQQQEIPAARTAFASYASTDRRRVLDAVIALEAVGVDVFQDCLDVHPGEAWKPRLLQELSTREMFVLFWSWAARESEWVAWELETVLETRGQEPVCVSPLEVDVPPPDRLAHLQFSHPGAWIRAALRE